MKVFLLALLPLFKCLEFNLSRAWRNFVMKDEVVDLLTLELNSIVDTNFLHLLELWEIEGFDQI